MRIASKVATVRDIGIAYTVVGEGTPLIVVHGTALRNVPDAYRRYLERFFAEAFQLRGTPLRIQFKAGANPYAESPGRRR